MKKLNVVSEDFKQTKAQLKDCADFIVKIKSKLLPHEKNSEEYSLKFYSRGLTSGPMYTYVNGITKFLEISIDFSYHKLIFSYENEIFELSLENIKTNHSKDYLRFLSNDVLGIEEELEDLRSKKDKKYSYESAESIWSTLKEIYPIFVNVKSQTLNETSNINFWPHHFDLAMLLFSGKTLPNENQSNWEKSREQINFGFLFGDKDIENPYFYVTTYPFNDQMLETKLKNNAYWFTDGWNGAILELEGANNENNKVLDFFIEVGNLAFANLYNA